MDRLPIYVVALINYVDEQQFFITLFTTIFGRKGYMSLHPSNFLHVLVCILIVQSGLHAGLIGCELERINRDATASRLIRSNEQPMPACRRD